MSHHLSVLMIAITIHVKYALPLHTNDIALSHIPGIHSGCRLNLNFGWSLTVTFHDYSCCVCSSLLLLGVVPICSSGHSC